ncbi:3-keto-disaccharide hydrolase [Aestuariivivens insulae]|uniref:3-keto-disaccharide hydrolase n=1 Tax=Aestuariivivens insulae TaxID=1621988 RepID=UPI001F57E8C7|nr:DUF1080 domain-containing protein [Aestuariivivens insulae]
MRSFFYLLITLVITVSCKQKKENVAVEENPAGIVETDVAKEWITLFDGNSLDNWRGYRMDEMPSEWIIEEGAMAFKPGETGGKNIITKQKFTNFVLSLEWKISEGGNSGIFWSVFEDEKFNEAYQTGPEIQVLDNAKHPDSFVEGGTHKAGSLYDMIACPDTLIKPAGEWNLCVLEVNHKTNQGKVSMNGTEVMTFPVHGEGWDKMVDNSKFKGWEGFGKYQTGHIGLQDHGNPVWFRNIKIKEL